MCVKPQSGLVVASKRIEACLGQEIERTGDRLDWTVEVYECSHNLTYTINEDGHAERCKYCEYSSSGSHSYIGENTTCSVCGFGTAVDIASLAFLQTPTASLEGYNSANYDVVKDATIALPECRQVPDGWKFVGWSKKYNFYAADFTSIEAADSETDLYQPGDDYKVSGDVMFFARYRYDFTPTWTWSDDLTSASLTIQAADEEPISVEQVTVSDRTETAATDEADGSITATATATYTHGSTTYTFSDTQKKVLSFDLSLGEVDNTEALTTYDGRSMNVTLTGRTLYKDGEWNTLCLPFDVALEDSPLAGATLKELADVAYNAETGTLTLTFADATRIKAGQAYLVKWDSGTNLGPSDLVFTGVTLSQTLSDDDISVDDSGTATVTFMGTYKKLSFDADDRTVLFLGSNNKLYYPQNGAYINAQRAYFKLSGLTAGDLSAGINVLTLDFGDEETTTGIGSLTPSPSSKGESDCWYTLDGRRLSGKPSHAGVYINNGKKVVVK